MYSMNINNLNGNTLGIQYFNKMTNVKKKVMVESERICVLEGWWEVSYRI